MEQEKEHKQVEMKDCEALADDDTRTEDYYPPSTPKNKREVDFCFSGGGIRACATAAGIFEGVLKTQTPGGTKPSLVYHPRFYSCVSGGGFFGGYLTSVATQLGAFAPDAGDDKWLAVLDRIESLPERSNFLVDFDPHNGENACVACLRGCAELVAMIGMVLSSIALFALKYFTIAVVSAEVLALFGSIKYDDELSDHGTLESNSKAAEGMREDIGIGALVMTSVGLLLAFAAKSFLSPQLAASSKPWAGALVLAGLHLAVIWVYRGLPDAGTMDGLVDSVFVLFIGLSMLLGNRTFTIIAIVMHVTAHVVVMRLWHSVGIFGYHWNYNKDTWDIYLWICATSMLLMPMILWIDSNKMRWYYQWRLGNAFDLNKVKHEDLKSSKFISGLATHRWMYEDDIEDGLFEPKRDVIAVDFSTNSVIRARSVEANRNAKMPTKAITQQPTLDSPDELNEWQHPRLQLSSNGFSLVQTVAISASAVADEFGKFPAGNTFPLIVKLAGCSLGAWMERHVDGDNKKPALTLLRCGYAVVPGMILTCLFMLWGLYIAADTTRVIRSLVFGLTVLYVMLLLGVVTCGDWWKTSRCKNLMGAWCYDSVALTMHSIFSMTELNNEFPEVTYLTDGGHVDNTGLMAYLTVMRHRQVTGGTVFMVDGTFYKEGVPFNDLEWALDDAQRRLGARLCRNPVTIIVYDDNGEKCAEQEFAGGIVEAMTHVRDFPDEARYVVVGPIKISLQMDDDDSAAFRVYFGRLLPGAKTPGMCCECCHGCCNLCACSRECSKQFFGEFPSHLTGCQFFTSTLFQEYQDATTVLGQRMRELALAHDAAGDTPECNEPGQCVHNTCQLPLDVDV